MLLLTTICIMVGVLQSLIGPSLCLPTPGSLEAETMTPPLLKFITIPRENLSDAYCAAGDPVPAPPYVSCHSCAGRCGRIKTRTHKRSIYCSCDTNCIAYADCCEDFRESCPMEFSRSLVLREHFKYRHAKCVIMSIALSSQFADDFTFDFRGYNFVSVCGQTGRRCKHIHSERLLQPNLAIPVLDASTGLHYINYDCARCNNVNNIVPWIPKLTCRSSDFDDSERNVTSTIDSPTKLSIYLPKCQVTYVIPVNFTARRFCDGEDSKKSCPLNCKNTKLVNQCEQSYTKGVIIGSKGLIFQNYHCALCSGEIAASLKCLFLDSPPISAGRDEGHVISRFSMSLLFDFNPANGMIVGRKTCSEGQKWLPGSNTCQRVVCPTDFRLLDDSCLPISIEISHSASILFNLTHDLQVVVQQLKMYNVSIIEHIAEQLRFVLPEDDRVTFTLTTIESDVLNVTLISRLLFSKNSTFNLGNDLDNFSYNVTRIFEDELVLLLHEASINLGYVQITIDDSSVVKDSLFTECTWHLFSEDTYQVHTDILTVKSTQKNYTEDRYRIVSTKALVCIQNMEETTGIYLDVSPALGILTIILISFSIVCLAIRLVLQFKIPYYGSFAGKLQFNLFLALCMAFLMLLFGGLVSQYDMKMVCTVFAILMYWFFLVAFCFMTTVTLDTWLVFRAAASFIVAGKTNKSLMKYVIPCWLVPAIITVILILLDFAMEIDTQFKPGFGAHICWFNQRFALLVYFGGPVAVLTIITTTFFILIVINLRRTLKSNIRNPSKQGSHQMTIYFKLFSLMGISWTIGFIAAFISHEALWILFIILNASQGILVFISFVLNRQVLRELRQTSWSCCRLGGAGTQFKESTVPSTELTQSTTIVLNTSIVDPNVATDNSNNNIPAVSTQHL